MLLWILWQRRVADLPIGCNLDSTVRLHDCELRNPLLLDWLFRWIGLDYVRLFLFDDLRDGLYGHCFVDCVFVKRRTLSPAARLAAPGRTWPHLAALLWLTRCPDV